MDWKNQYRLPGGSKHGCWGCIRDRAKRRDAAKCRRGHLRTEANTYIDPSGKRFCTDCPTKTYAERKKVRDEGGTTGPRKLTDREIARLRSQVGCVVCGETPQEIVVQEKNKAGELVDVVKVKTKHHPSCSVPFNVEGIPQKRGPKSKRSQVFEPRPPTPCENCGDLIDQVWPKRTLRYCSRVCNTQAYRARQKAAAEVSS